jgi:hypothetical protein
MTTKQYAANQAMRTRHARRMQDVDYGTDEEEGHSQSREPLTREPLNRPAASDQSIKSSPGRRPARAEEKTTRYRR